MHYVLTLLPTQWLYVQNEKFLTLFDKPQPQLRLSILLRTRSCLSFNGGVFDIEKHFETGSTIPVT